MPSGYRTDLDGQRAANGKSTRARWSKAMRAAFLDHLAATCNVTQSAAVANVDVRTVYELRRRNARFAERWEAALALGYQMVETLLVGHVLAGHRAGDPVHTHQDGLPAVDFEAAMRLLAAHRNPVGKPRKGGGTLQFAAPDETDAVLLKRLKAIEMRRAREAEWAAQTEAGKAGLLPHDAGASDPVPARDAVIEHAPQAEGARDGE
ncbi:hypothetical protein [Sphingomonas sp. J315]|uniref:hypothetical protein n=1 Tax=Sphingomonas sp. J315 TaxID=2898433 RepID=UPI0021AD9E9E|nr:hypothetical protein [Sphingomonas sp. J315]UUY01053.1 hypothetical protein LRS08_08415 [Sphingomonas sp. J315]